MLIRCPCTSSAIWRPWLRRTRHRPQQAGPFFLLLREPLVTVPLRAVHWRWRDGEDHRLRPKWLVQSAIPRNRGILPRLWGAVSALLLLTGMATKRTTCTFRRRSPRLALHPRPQPRCKPRRLARWARSFGRTRYARRICSRRASHTRRAGSDGHRAFRGRGADGGGACRLRCCLRR